MTSMTSIPRLLTLSIAAASAAALSAPALAQRGGERWVLSGTRVGDSLPALEVVELDGRTHALSDAWSKGPVLLVTSSLTCPVARGTCAELPGVGRELGGAAEVLLLYTTEAHPTSSSSPYRPKDGPWVTLENEREGILRDQPSTLEARLALAREFKERTKTELPIVVDAMDNAAWTALGGGPNMAVLVDSNGVVRLKQGWIDSKSIAEAVRKELNMASSKSDSGAGAGSRKLSSSGYDITPLTKERVKELAKSLSPEAHRITQRSGTEPPGSCGILLDNKKDGVYTCVVCGLPLFASEHKFHSGTGWPSFFSPFDPQHVSERSDESHGMVRTEINCARCDAHLGHVFDDGPRDKTGLRYCLNGVALTFHAKEDPLPPESRPASEAQGAKGAADGAKGAPAGAKGAAESATETAYFAGGCFWGIEHVFSKCPGVLDAKSGYMNGTSENPTYEQVCGKKTGHAEAVMVVFDPKKVTYRQLLEGFFLMHDPTELNRQGPDIGDQYRSAVFTANDRQLAEARAIVKELAASGRFKKPIVTVVEPAQKFFPAEQYHQDYVDRTGRVCHVSDPWPTVLGAAAR
ncbi:MAG: bifunctional methionine sulfoxide reductase B/A protein [Phycisphaerae bacterium]|nr:bifunctional methionine sulfoxide reductase B/A protein [Phycisphaerae bacterium]